MKARLGSIDANPDIWLRLMLCDLLDAPTALAACCGFDLCHKYILYLYLYLGGPMHEMGVEYTEAIAVLLKRISSRMWDRDISDIAVHRVRQAVRDRTTLHWVTGRHIKNWYLQRAVLAGYDAV